MSADPRKYLHDALVACERIEALTEGKTLSDYKNSLMLHSAVERQFQILGEAILQFQKHFPDEAVKIPHLREITGFRHVLVHGYDKVEHETVWGIVTTRLSELRAVLGQLLSG